MARAMASNRLEWRRTAFSKRSLLVSAMGELGTPKVKTRSGRESFRQILRHLTAESWLAQASSLTKASRVQLSHLSKPKEKNMSEHESRREFLKQAAVAGALAAAGCQSEKNGDKTVKNPTGGPATRPSTMPTANNKLNV